MGKWLSRKLFLVVSGGSVIAYLPIVYKQVGVSDAVALLVLGTLTSIILWYLKINKDSKFLEVPVGSDNRDS